MDASAVNISMIGGSTVTNSNVAQNFSLTIKYGSNKIIINTIDDHYRFTAPEGALPCEVYNFSVTAAYVGGTYSGPDCGAKSEVIGRMLPSLPDIQQLEASLNYSLLKNDSNIKLLVSFMVGYKHFLIKNLSCLHACSKPHIAMIILLKIIQWW